MMPSLLLVPLLQIVGVAASLWSLRHWRRDSQSQPTIGQDVFLPIPPNLLVILNLMPLLGEIGGFLLLFALDYALVATGYGGFAAGWVFMRSWLVK
jgi:hypothetical protein